MKTTITTYLVELEMEVCMISYIDGLASLNAAQDTVHVLFFHFPRR